MLSCPLSLNNVYCYAQTHSRSCWCATCWDGLDGLFELFGNRVEMLGLWPSSDKLRFDCARSGNRRICQTSDLSPYSFILYGMLVFFFPYSFYSSYSLFPVLSWINAGFNLQSAPAVTEPVHQPSRRDQSVYQFFRLRQTE